MKSMMKWQISKTKGKKHNGMYMCAQRILNPSTGKKQVLKYIISARVLPVEHPDFSKASQYKHSC